MVALRPRSLLVALSPVLVGAALGHARTGAIDIHAALLVLASATLVQLVTNLQNDVGFFLRGGESSGKRVGLPRATANGWLSAREVRAAIVLAAVAATVLGLWLASDRGWPVLAIGVASLLAALAYMGGPWPIAYTPRGEATVFIFFGLVAVMGTDWALTGSLGAVDLPAAMAIGSLAAAALAVNNHRDREHDRQIGRRTFAVRFGPGASGHFHATLLLAPYALLPWMALAANSPALLLPLIQAPWALRLLQDFRHCPPGPDFNTLVFRSFQLELGYAVLLSAGAVLSRTAA